MGPRPHPPPRSAPVHLFFLGTCPEMAQRCYPVTHRTPTVDVMVIRRGGSGTAQIYRFSLGCSMKETVSRTGSYTGREKCPV